MTAHPVVGRRERKKAATRKAISDAATRLFLERGFDAVSIREVADVADVSPTTVFAYFPQKEALVFDEDDAQRDELVEVVRDRPSGTSISQALRDYFVAEYAAAMSEHGRDSLRTFMALVNATPSLREYADRMWLRHEDALAQVIATQLGLAEPSGEVRAYARFVLQLRTLADGSPDPVATIAAGFRVLDEGWAAIEVSTDPSTSSGNVG